MLNTLLLSLCFGSEGAANAVSQSALPSSSPLAVSKGEIRPDSQAVLPTVTSTHVFLDDVDVARTTPNASAARLRGSQRHVSNSDSEGDNDDADADADAPEHDHAVLPVDRSGKVFRSHANSNNDVELGSTQSGPIDTVQPQLFPSEFKRFAQHILGTDIDPETRASLEKLWTIETSWRNSVRWASIDSMLQRVGYFLGINRDGIIRTDAEDKRWCAKPVWLSGGSFPLASEHNRKLVQFIDGLRQGTEFIIFRGIHLSITALVIYQLYNWIHQIPALPCQKQTATGHSLRGLYEFYKTSDDNVLLGIFHDVFGPQGTILPYLKYTLLAPVVFGLGKGAWRTRQTHLTEEEIATSLAIIADVEPGIYDDLFRWFLPLHPIDRQVNTLMKNALWNPEVSVESLQNIFNVLQTLVLEDRGYTSIHALGYLMSFVHGTNMADVTKLLKKQGQDEVGREELDAALLPEEGERQTDGPLLQAIDPRLKLKARAFAILQEAALFHKEDQRKSLLGHGVALYAQYLLWSLGSSRSWPEAAFNTVFKGTKLYAQAILIKKIVEVALAAEQCPSQPGVSLAGVEPWAKDLTQQCFDAYVKLFNVIPGQPTETLVGNLDQYYFPDCSVSLDLSNKDLDWRAIYNITKALFDHNITIRTLNLSRNNVNTKEAFEAILPALAGIRELDLSNNGIGGTQDNPSYIPSELGQKLGKLTTLRQLRLAGNGIGSNDGTDPSGTIVLGQGISQLHQLTSLDLSRNWIGFGDDNSTIAIGQGIGQLKQLRFFSFSGNGWQGGSYYYGPFNTVTAISDGISQLHQLLSLDLSDNMIGSYCFDGLNASSTLALAKSIAQLKTLTSLDLSDNMIGVCGDDFGCNSSDAITLCQGVGQLKQLRILELSGNGDGGESGGGICCGTNIKALMDSLTLLQQLRIFTLSCENNTINQEINKVLRKYTNATPLMTLLSSEEDVAHYCETLPLDAHVVNLSGLLSFLLSFSDLAIQELMMCLGNRTVLTSVDFSNNDIGDFSNFDTFSQGIGQLKQITTLDLSRNHIGYCNPGFICLPLSIVFGQNLAQLGNLRFLNLSGNWIGRGDYVNTSGTIAFGQGLGRLRQLRILDLSGNKIGYGDFTDGVRAIGEGISQLKQLRFLDFSSNDGLFGVCDGSWCNSSVAITLAQEIGQLKALTSLNLAGTALSTTPSIVALANALNFTRQLSTLNLGSNPMGSLGPEGPSALLKILPQLPDLDLSRLDLSGMTNISWTKSANDLARLHSSLLMNSCQNNRCFRNDISAQQALTPASHSEFSKRRAVDLEVSDGNKLVQVGSTLNQYDRMVTESTIHNFSPVTSSASYPSFPLLGQVRDGLVFAYDSLLALHHNPDVQMISYVWAASQLATYTVAQTWPLLAGYLVIAV